MVACAPSLLYEAENAFAKLIKFQSRFESDEIFYSEKFYLNYFNFMKNLKNLSSKIEKSNLKKNDISALLGNVRGGEDNSGAVSSSYTSGTRDCSTTAICKICIKG